MPEVTFHWEVFFSEPKLNILTKRKNYAKGIDF